jgi:DNA-binding phage protein
MAKPHRPGKGRAAIVLNDRAVLRLLRAAVEKEGGQSSFARHHGLHASHINKVMNARARVTKSIAKALGLRTVYVAE